MQNNTRQLLLAAMLFAVAACAAPYKQAPQSELGWLDGCWQTRSGATQEVWSVSAPTLLFGYNTAQKDGEVSFFEQLRIEKSAQGWVYYAYPRGQGPTIFREKARAAGRIDFINPDHDYPQLIRYSRQGTVLTATIADASGSNARDWTYIPCKP